MIVIKFGGHAMTDEHGAFAQAIAEAMATGVTPVVVHGVDLRSEMRSRSQESNHHL